MQLSGNQIAVIPREYYQSSIHESAQHLNVQSGNGNEVIGMLIFVHDITSLLILHLSGAVIATITL
jgi:hypothetical protein